MCQNVLSATQDANSMILRSTARSNTVFAIYKIPPRSLQSWVSTIQTVVLTADVFQLFIKKIMLGWKQYEYYYETVELPNTSPTQPNKYY